MDGVIGPLKDVWRPGEAIQISGKYNPKLPDSQVLAMYDEKIGIKKGCLYRVEAPLYMYSDTSYTLTVLETAATIEWTVNAGGVVYLQIFGTPRSISSDSSAEDYYSYPPADSITWKQIVSDLALYLSGMDTTVTDSFLGLENVPSLGDSNICYGLWDEPNGDKFFKGPNESFYELYCITAEALQSLREELLPEGGIQPFLIGGVETAMHPYSGIFPENIGQMEDAGGDDKGFRVFPSSGPRSAVGENPPPVPVDPDAIDEGFIEGWISACSDREAPIEFVSFHHYEKDLPEFFGGEGETDHFSWIKTTLDAYGFDSTSTALMVAEWYCGIHGSTNTASRIVTDSTFHPEISEYLMNLLDARIDGLTEIEASYIPGFISVLDSTIDSTRARKDKQSHFSLQQYRRYDEENLYNNYGITITKPLLFQPLCQNNGLVGVDSTKIEGISDQRSNIILPNFNTMRMLSMLENTELELHYLTPGTLDSLLDKHWSIGGVATKDTTTNEVAILLWFFMSPNILLQHGWNSPIEYVDLIDTLYRDTTHTVNITLSTSNPETNAIYEYERYLIDYKHSNSYAYRDSIRNWLLEGMSWEEINDFRYRDNEDWYPDDFTEYVIDSVASYWLTTGEFIQSGFKDLVLPWADYPDRDGISILLNRCGETVSFMAPDTIATLYGIQGFPLVKSIELDSTGHNGCDDIIYGFFQGSNPIYRLENVCDYPPLSFVGVEPGIYQPERSGLLTCMDVADFDGDGWEDIVAGYDDGSIAFFGLWRDGGRYEYQYHYRILDQLELPGPVTDVKVGDFDLLYESNSIDIAATTEDTTYIFINNGLGNFFMPTKFSPGCATFDGLQTADCNRDGLDDIILAETGSEMLWVFLGDGDYFFQEGNGYSYVIPYFYYTTVELGDINKDGYLDALVNEWADYPYTILLLGDGSGGFQAPVLQNVYYGYDSVIEDFNGDYCDDISTLDRDNEYLDWTSVNVAGGRGVSIAMDLAESETIRMGTATPRQLQFNFPMKPNSVSLIMLKPQ